ncbi:nitrate/sulfonate/bicarbonate ABC transporter ATP-binding protein [Thiotrichales bacterium 19S11-10]|nr:nitrate/sulfonate/bicarbonate ABC transporter ATP-binding protein [Thiotrichales bacterium 19S11-10]MCF6807514.1 nitrate/sulfonate/bicarbonate ABC transporter ATP-binding protein [Thiotrichales bacterium 19S9-11]MCF6811483.1 nitrate/sulfonate/bicarbonate ABC transporter ATP-binding protein [Thiotrichales bacterium 19S9-12]
MNNKHSQMALADTSEGIISVSNVNKAFKNPDKQDLVVLEKVNFTLNEGEIVALLGKSGSGKSTLLRIIAGLSAPTSGDVLYRKQPVKSPISDISMVFQSFALMPWLTVLENVELGLEARKIPRKERRKRAIDAIDMIGLDGFENAYPKELSGGMRQRVGFARALVLKPDVLLMDEPFSALDVLTAETLREDLLELWDKNNDMKGILFVTHNIEEAVLTADRVVIFGSNPGFIRGELKIDLPRPRNAKDLAVGNLIDEVYRMMTTAQTKELGERMNRRRALTIAYRLPDTEISELTGLLSEMYDMQEKGAIDLPDLADYVRLDVDDLFPVLEILSVLQLAHIAEGDITMTELGKTFVNADITDRKVLFSRLLLQNIPLARHIIKVLKERPNKRAHQARFLTELEDYFSEKEAERVFNTFIDWARYAEIIEYDYNSKTLSLDETNS